MTMDWNEQLLQEFVASLQSIEILKQIVLTQCTIEQQASMASIIGTRWENSHMKWHGCEQRNVCLETGFKSCDLD